MSSGWASFSYARTNVCSSISLVFSQSCNVVWAICTLNRMFMEACLEGCQYCQHLVIHMSASICMCGIALLPVCQFVGSVMTPTLARLKRWLYVQVSIKYLSDMDRIISTFMFVPAKSSFLGLRATRFGLTLNWILYLFMCMGEFSSSSWETWTSSWPQPAPERILAGYGGFGKASARCQLPRDRKW